MTSSRAVRILAALSFVAGSTLSFLADLLLFMVDDSCPQWEDEGPMAAPGSPYSLVMCGPGVEPPFVWAWYAGVGGALAVGVLVLARRGDRVLRALPGLALVLLGPALLVGLLHLTLPQDCLSGRTAAGDCARDREKR
ncbi:MAG TPA: hypothetical protein VLB29_16495 [Nocardioidaceae bacterium]|nr:hypothetical protein [Nocardioidaceae bacterium]